MKDILLALLSLAFLVFSVIVVVPCMIAMSWAHIFFTPAAMLRVHRHMRVDITVESGFKPSFKTESLKSKFDLQIDRVVETLRDLELELPRAVECRRDLRRERHRQDDDRASIYSASTCASAHTAISRSSKTVAPARSLDEITDVFNKVGFSSPPSWLKPYHVLSNGEKMRVDLAERILASDDHRHHRRLRRIHESVVSRPVAKICSYAVAK
jgi:hypothetical protein